MSLNAIGRLAPLAGIVSVALFVGGSLATNVGWLPDASEVKEFFDEDTWTLKLGAYALVLSGVLLIVHGAVVFRSLSGGSEQIAPLIGMSGVFAAAVLLLVQGTLINAGASRGTVDGGISEIEAMTLYDAGLLGIAVPVALGVHLLGTGIAWFRTRDFPVWFIWVTVIIGIVLILPEGFFLSALALLWIAIVSVVTFRRQGATAT